MRKCLVALSLALLSQFVVMAQVNHSSSKSTIEGSGNLITRDVAIQPFDQLEISGVFNVILTQGSKEEVKIEADDNLQSLFEVRNEGSTLRVSMKKESNFNSKHKVKLYVAFKNLKSMDLKTVGDLRSTESLRFTDLKLQNKSVGNVDLKLTAQTLTLDNKSVGSVKLDGKADNAVIRSNSVGSIHAGNFVVQTMDIDNKGVGSAEVNAEKELKVKDNMLGKVNNKGAARQTRVNKVTI